MELNRDSRSAPSEQRFNKESEPFFDFRSGTHSEGTALQSLTNSSYSRSSLKAATKDGHASEEWARGPRDRKNKNAG